MERAGAVIALALALAPAAARAQVAAQESVFDLQAILAPQLDGRTLKTSEKDGVVTEEVMFYAATDGAKRVNIFGLFAYPRGGRKLPAFVWNQGSLARASTYFTDFGARRGYAVLCIDFPMPGYRSTGGYPITSGLELGDDPRKAPIYFGAVALLRAVTYLQTRPEVDAARIGMAGSSWGGFYTTLMAGLDPRLKAASAMFGTGNLQLGNLWWDGGGMRTRDGGYRERWRTTLDPAWRLPRSRTATAWFTGTNDTFYWLPAVSRTYEMAADPKHLTLLPNWDHALPGTIDEQVFTWLDIHLRGKPAFLRVGPLHLKKEGERLAARWGFDGPTSRRATGAELAVSYGDGDPRGRWWVTVPAEISKGACAAVLPDCSLPCHVVGAVVDADGFRSSTPPLRAVPAQFGVRPAAVLPHYNGCGLWGGFEEYHIEYLKLHGHGTAAVSRVAKEGKQSAVLRAGTSTLPPIYGTTGQPHRFTCWMRAERPVDVGLALEARTPGKPTTAEAKVTVRTGWTEVVIPFRSPPDTVGPVRAHVTVPQGAEVLMDAVSFHPARE